MAFFLKYPTPILPQGVQTTGKIKVTKVTDDSATAVLTLSDKDKTGKVTDSINDLGTATLKKATTGEIEVYSGTSKVGTYTNGELTLLGKNPTLGNITITGKKS